MMLFRAILQTMAPRETSHGAIIIFFEEYWQMYASLSAIMKKKSWTRKQYEDVSIDENHCGGSG